ncbi:MAG TPA: hypothetical protein DCX89_07250 [Saprospirales bacterium]|nr:hypothetical protein [Saprospirales bacterium]HRQ30177.1 DUF302 domain-containing protein [Saprospiraceae bacterium]
MILFLAGLIAGMVITLIVIIFFAQSFMFAEKECKYDFEQSVELLTNSALENGWKVPAVHDLRETMLKFGKPEVAQAKVFEICHPDHAIEILSRDKERKIMPMMPCRIAVYQKSDGKCYVSVMQNGLLGSLMKGVVPRVMRAASRESHMIIQAILPDHQK